MASERVSRKMVLEIKYVNANNAVIHTENSKLLFDLNYSLKELEKTVVNNCAIEHSAANRGFSDHSIELYYVDHVTGIWAKISLGTGIWAKFRLGTGIWYPPTPFTTLV